MTDPDYWVCDCGSDLRVGDHGRCWMLTAYDHDDLKEMMR